MGVRRDYDLLDQLLDFHFVVKAVFIYVRSSDNDLSVNGVMLFDNGSDFFLVLKALSFMYEWGQWVIFLDEGCSVIDSS